MPMLKTFRAMVPQSYRAALMRNRVTSALFRSFVRKHQLRRHPRCDCKFAFDGQRAIGWALGGLEEWEQDYFVACDRIFRTLKPRVVWDVGANVGIWSLFFARSFDSVSTVVAYEPDRENLQLLSENIAMNSLASRVRVRPVALSATAGTADFQVDSVTGTTGSLETGEGFITRYYGRKTMRTSVQVTTVDRELADGVPVPEFLKIDVEGHEDEVFRGAQQMLKEHRPIMIVEFTGPRSSESWRLLRDCRYVLLCPITGKVCDGIEYELVAVPEEKAGLIANVLAGGNGQLTSLP